MVAPLCQRRLVFRPTLPDIVRLSPGWRRAQKHSTKWRSRQSRHFRIRDHGEPCGADERFPHLSAPVLNRKRQEEIDEATTLGALIGVSWRRHALAQPKTTAFRGAGRSTRNGGSGACEFAPFEQAQCVR